MPTLFIVQPLRNLFDLTSERVTAGFLSVCAVCAGGEDDGVKAQGFRLIEQLEADVDQTGIAQHPDAQTALSELKVLFGYLRALGVLHKVPMLILPLPQLLLLFDQNLRT